VCGLALLECFTGERPSRGIAEISEELGMGRSTTHRYATTLVELGFLERDRERRYRLGLGGADVAFSLLESMQLRELAMPYLRQLRQRSRCTVALAVRDGDEVLCILRMHSHRMGWRSTLDVMQVGSRTAVNATSLGQALLLKQGASARAGSEEGSAGSVRSIAACIYDERGEAFAAVGLLAPAIAYSARELTVEFASDVLSTAELISAGLVGAPVNRRTR
jgi:DNA-binding IclR family transcriptional regulator